MLEVSAAVILRQEYVVGMVARIIGDGDGAKGDICPSEVSRNKTVPFGVTSDPRIGDRVIRRRCFGPLGNGGAKP